MFCSEEPKDRHLWRVHPGGTSMLIMILMLMMNVLLLVVALYPDVVAIVSDCLGCC